MNYLTGACKGTAGVLNEAVDKGTPTPKSSGCMAAGAGWVNPPVLYKWADGLIIPALPICKTEEFEIPPILTK